MKFTTTRVNTANVENWPISLPFGVRPSERSCITFEASSNSPSAAMANVATSAAISSKDGSATSSTVATMATIMTTPPIVGVPCFTRWLCGPSARTCCPIWVRVSSLIHAGISTMVMAAASTKPRNTRNVGEDENRLLSITRRSLRRHGRDA